MIRGARASDFNSIWEVFRHVVQKGTTYVYPADTAREKAQQIWLGETVRPYVAEQKGKVVGTYIIKPNYSGRGAHVANGSYMVHPDYRRQGIGQAMGEHSLKEAKKAGFQAMQFNMVVSTNTAAVTLWKKLGFRIVGTLPKVFDHPEKGLVDAYLMHQFLK